MSCRAMHDCYLAEATPFLLPSCQVTMGATAAGRRLPGEKRRLPTVFLYLPEKWVHRVLYVVSKFGV